MTSPKPQAGDRVFLCVHLRDADSLPSGVHIYAFNWNLEPIWMTPPDGTPIEGKWMAICHDCMADHEQTGELPDIADDRILDRPLSFQTPS